VPRAIALALLVCLLLIALPLFAHHGDAGRFEENVTILTGTVVEVELADPRSIIVIDLPNETRVMAILPLFANFNDWPDNSQTQD
jgi:hypothetical protein